MTISKSWYVKPSWAANYGLQINSDPALAVGIAHAICSSGTSYSFWTPTCQADVDDICTQVAALGDIVEEIRMNPVDLSKYQKNLFTTPEARQNLCPAKPKCECGSSAVGSSLHSSYCPLA